MSSPLRNATRPRLAECRCSRQRCSSSTSSTSVTVESSSSLLPLPARPRSCSAIDSVSSRTVASATLCITASSIRPPRRPSGGSYMPLTVSRVTFFSTGTTSSLPVRTGNSRSGNVAFHETGTFVHSPLFSGSPSSTVTRLRIETPATRSPTSDSPSPCEARKPGPRTALQHAERTRSTGRSMWTECWTYIGIEYRARRAGKTCRSARGPRAYRPIPAVTLRPRRRVTTARSGSKYTSSIRSLSGMIALSVMWMCSGQTSCAALGDVAVAHAGLALEQRPPVEHVLRVHLEAGDADHEARSVVALLAGRGRAGRGRRPGRGSTRCTCETRCTRSTSFCCIRHGSLVVQVLLRRRERRDLLVHLVVPADVGDQVLDQRERLHRPHRDRRAVVGDRRLAHQARKAVDLGRARAALGRLAVPAHRQVGGQVGLDPEHRVEHDHALAHRDAVGDQLARRWRRRARS